MAFVFQKESAYSDSQRTKKDEYKGQKKYSTRASRVVSHLSTVRAVSSLNFPDQTRGGTFYRVWPYGSYDFKSTFVRRTNAGEQVL
jgi:hypothetical protein